VIGKMILCLLALSCVIVLLPLHAQVAGTVPAAPNITRINPRPLPLLPAPGFAGMSRAAGMIFSGAVVRIERGSAAPNPAVETVSITFHVDQGIRGARAGDDITISQWLGVWSSGQRYRIGEHVFLFLYPPSKLGLTSLVAGPMGRFGVDAAGYVFLSDYHLAAFRTDPVLGGKSRLRLSDFALAVRRACEEE